MTNQSLNALHLQAVAARKELAELQVSIEKTFGQMSKEAIDAGRIWCRLHYLCSRSKPGQPHHAATL